MGILIGGGSGHEPAFVGYVGKGLADAAAIGNVFASPGPEPVLEATKEINGGAGVLYLYGNYAGDVMNFDMAAEMAAMEDIEVRTVLVTDDVASAPPDRREERRGVAGDFFVFKIAGAAADLGADLDAVEAAARKANEATLTMGVALEPCSLPATLRPNFTLGDDEMEIGLGIHGEPGVERGPIRRADHVADTLLDRILAELDAGAGDSVAVLVNGLGATSLMELYILYRRVVAAAGRCGNPHPCQLGRRIRHVAGDGRRVDHADEARRRTDPAARPSRRLRHVRHPLSRPDAPDPTPCPRARPPATRGAVDRVDRKRHRQGRPPTARRHRCRFRPRSSPTSCGRSPPMFTRIPIT